MSLSCRADDRIADSDAPEQLRLNAAFAALTTQKINLTNRF